MKFFSLAALSVTALFSMVQYCPAPFAVVGPILGMTTEAITAADSVLASMASGAIAGGISAGAAKSKGGKGKRGVPAGFPPGVSEQAWQQCENQLKGAHIYLKGKPNNGVEADGVPPACMDLATVITGHPTQEGGPVPTVMGSATLLYNGLSQAELAQLGQILKAKGIIH